jgi:sialic acid synthase SpsE
MMDFAKRKVGSGAPCLVVAELGTSHQGDQARARELVDAARQAGAECVKLQMVYADEILHPLCGKVELPTGSVELYAHFKALEKEAAFYAEVKRYAESRGLLFLCSAFGMRSARELRAMGVAAIKIASPELNHFPLLREVSTYGIPIVLSSGVSTLGDIERAIAITGDTTVLLHCVTAYPAPEDEYNLKLLRPLGAIFGVETGISDHSLDPLLVPVLAVLNGACLVEKHFTLSRAGSGLDDPIALEPAAFRSMVEGIRAVEHNASAARRELSDRYGAERLSRVEGTGAKRLAPSERENYSRTNRSIHALDEIPEGARITAEMISVLRTEKKLRPGMGPEFLPVVIGSRATRVIPAGEGIVWDDLI